MSTASRRRKSAQVEAATSLVLQSEVKYLLALPDGYAAKRSKRWPLLVFLHGSGERGESPEVLRKFGPAARVEQGKEFPFILLTPLCPRYEWWNTDVVEGLIADISRRYRVDADRVYLTGLSMGGFGVWALAAKHPERYAAILPICGEGEWHWAKRMAALPVWAFHGELDPVVPVARTREMIAALREAGGRPKLTIYKKLYHDSWTKTYANEAVYAWMLKQRRSA